MTSNITAEMTASIIIDKKEVISSALEAYASAQKELDGKKIELSIDVSSEEARKHLNEIQQELDGKKYTIKFQNQGMEETLKTLDELQKRIKEVISGKFSNNKLSVLSENKHEEPKAAKHKIDENLCSNKIYFNSKQIQEAKSFLDIIKNKAWDTFTEHFAEIFGINNIKNAFEQGIETAKEYDTALTNISYATDMTKKELDNLGKSVLDMASDMRTSIDDAMSAAQIYTNLNTTAEEIQQLSKSSLILSNLTGFDLETVANDIQSVNQQFEIAAEESMHIADVYDYISRNISAGYSKGIESMAEVVQIAGTTAKQAGVNFEQLMAIAAKAQEKTQLDGSQIGNGINTIMTRLSKAGVLSDDADNETLSQASEALHQIGVEVYNLDGSYRQFHVIMSELAEKWDSLTEAEQANISYNIAATRQTSLLSAILEDFSNSMELAEEAANANGSALKSQEKYMDSFSGHLQALSTESKIAWINFLDSDALKTGIDLLTHLVKVLGEAGNVLGSFGTLSTIGAGIAGAKGLGLTDNVTVIIVYKSVYIRLCNNAT